MTTATMLQMTTMTTMRSSWNDFGCLVERKTEAEKKEKIGVNDDDFVQKEMEEGEKDDNHAKCNNHFKHYAYGVTMTS